MIEQFQSNTNEPTEVTALVTPDDPAIIMFTSGTTGVPKGALLSHFSVVNNALITMKSFINVPREQLSFCVPLPFFHSFAAVVGCLGMTAAPFKMGKYKHCLCLW